MPVAEILAMPFGEWAAHYAHLYLWVTNNYLPAGLECVKAWGFRYVSAITWVKARTVDVPVCGGCFRYVEEILSILRASIHGDKDPEVLLSELLGKGTGATNRDGISNSEGSRIARLELQTWVDGFGERVSAALSSRSSTCEQEERIGAGAPSGDVPDSRSSTAVGRTGAPREREETGQQAGESTGDESERTHERASSCDVSAVQPCLLCGSHHGKSRVFKLENAGLGQYYRGMTEHCLFAVRGSLGYQVLEDGKRAQGTTGIYEPENLPSMIEAPRQRHSVKPERMRGYIERVSPGPYLELFARKASPGWDVWGNEAPEGE